MARLRRETTERVITHFHISMLALGILKEDEWHCGNLWRLRKFKCFPHCDELHEKYYIWRDKMFKMNLKRHRDVTKQNKSSR